MPPSKFEQQLAMARAWEMRAATWVRRQGWYTLPLYDFSGLADDKAPNLASIVESENLVMPDLLLVGGGETRWLEIKFKTHADWTHKTQQYETGIELRLWDQYCRVQEVSGREVYVLFVHLREDAVLLNSINELRAMDHRTYLGPRMGRGGMIFFPFDALTLMGPLGILEAA